MFPFADEPGDPVQRLLRLGDRLGYLTYQMLNDSLPEELVTPNELDVILMEIETRGIRLIDEADEGWERTD